jgi:hypothetical protein
MLLKKKRATRLGTNLARNCFLGTPRHFPEERAPDSVCTPPVHTLQSCKRRASRLPSEAPVFLRPISGFEQDAARE